MLNTYSIRCVGIARLAYLTHTASLWREHVIPKIHAAWHKTAFDGCSIARSTQRDLGT